MPTDPPIACTLDADERPKRLDEISALGATELLSMEHGDREAVLHFRPAARVRVEALVAAEAQCCAFLGFALTEDAAGLTLLITAPAGGEPVLHDLVAAFSGTT